MKSNILGTLLAATVALGGLAACDNMDALYTQYMQEQTYSGKISNLQGQSGTGRVVLTWTNPEDQISKKIKIVYGDDKQEKIYETLVDEASIDGLTASAYQFTVYTMDAFGNLSVPVSISKTLYTQSHINGMEPPRCLLAKQEDGTYTLTFSGLCNSMMMFGGELKYTIRGGGAGACRRRDLRGGVRVGSVSCQHEQHRHQQHLLFLGQVDRSYDHIENGYLEHLMQGVTEVYWNGERDFGCAPRIIRG